MKRDRTPGSQPVSTTIANAKKSGHVMVGIVIVKGKGQDAKETFDLVSQALRSLPQQDKMTSMLLMPLE